MDLKELTQKLKEINKMGFIKTHRAGDTGIGKTLEDLLNIPENPGWLFHLTKFISISSSIYLVNIFTFIG